LENVFENATDSSAKCVVVPWNSIGLTAFEIMFERVVALEGFEGHWIYLVPGPRGTEA
jgi:hypothetical protein